MGSFCINLEIHGLQFSLELFRQRHLAEPDLGERASLSETKSTAPRPWDLTHSQGVVLDKNLRLYANGIPRVLLAA